MLFIKTFFKPFYRYAIRCLMALGGLTGTYIFLSIVLSLLSTSPPNSACRKEHEVFISSNGVHLDLIIPQKILSIKLLNNLDLPSSPSYITFGWGDREFYLNTPTWADFNLITGLRAAFLRQPTVIHLSWYQKPHPSWEKVLLCSHQLKLLNGYLENWFEYDQLGKLIEIEASGYAASDRFYAAKGSYNCIQTCNNWVNNALKEAEVKTSIWSPFDKGVLYQLKRSS